MKNAQIITIFLAFCFSSGNIFASYEVARKQYYADSQSIGAQARVVQHLANAKLYYSAVPILKDLLKTVEGKLPREIDLAIEQLVTNVGIKQFEILPINVLSRSSSPTLVYILGKKYFRKGHYEKSIRLLNRILPGHPTYPFALFIKGSAQSILKRYDSSINTFNTCMEESKGGSGRLKIKQLKTNHDYCMIGIARTHYASGNFEKAKSQYLDLPKSSFVWPEILFEEAWNSYNLGNFNRTLGKLVTYNSPFFDNIFNPEVNVLRALTYLKLCLWVDAKREVDSFYERYQEDSILIRKYLRENGKNYIHYFNESRTSAKGIKLVNNLLSKFIRSIVFETTYQELYRSVLEARMELKKLRSMNRDEFNKKLIKNAVNSINQQKDIIGSYIRRKLILKYTQIYKAFEQMSNIKLEVLSRRKAELYDINYNLSRKRGDVRYLKRTDKQYFWTFNGEFWADELGDYVFALGSECK